MLQRCIPTCTYIHNMYTRIHRHAHVCMDLHTYIHKCLHIYICICIQIYIRICTYLYIHTRIHVCVCIRADLNTYAYTYIYDIHTYIYISHMKTDTCVVQMHSMRGNSAAWWLPTPKMKPVYFVLHIISTTERQASVWCNVHIVGASRAIAEARVEFNEPIDLSATSARSLCKHSPD